METASCSFNVIRVSDPAKPTLTEKRVLLNGFFHKSFIAEDFKFAALVAAIRDENNINKLLEISDGLTLAFSGLDIGSLRSLVLEIPMLEIIWEKLKRFLGHRIGTKIIDLIFWNSIIFPNIIEESVSNFMLKLDDIEEEKCPEPNRVLRIFSGQDKMELLILTHMIAPDVGYLHCSFSEIFKILISGFNASESQPVLLKKDFDPLASSYDTNWEHSEYFSKTRCVGVCSFLPLSEKTETVSTDTGSYFKVFDGSLICLKYLLFYGIEVKTIATSVPKEESG